MAAQLCIVIVDGRLARIFDSLSPNQDVYVELVCCYADGSEKVVGKTEVCENGNLTPRWNERFVCGRGAGPGKKTLKFKVMISRQLRGAVLCGEGGFDLDLLWSQASAGSKQVQVPLFKQKAPKPEQTGSLNISIGVQGAAGAPQAAQAQQQAARASSGPLGSGAPGQQQQQQPYAQPPGAPGVGMDQGGQYPVAPAQAGPQQQTSQQQQQQQQLQQQQMQQLMQQQMLQQQQMQQQHLLQQQQMQQMLQQQMPAQHMQQQMHPQMQQQQQMPPQMQAQQSPPPQQAQPMMPQHMQPQLQPSAEQSSREQHQQQQQMGPPTGAPLPAGASGESGAWWNSFIDRG